MPSTPLSTPLLQNLSKDYDLPFSNEHSFRDDSNYVDIIDSKYTKEDKDKLRVFADPNDIHIIDSLPIQSSATSSSHFNDILNNNKIVSWSYNTLPNNANTQYSFIPNKLKKPNIISYDKQNQMIYGQSSQLNTKIGQPYTPPIVDSSSIVNNRYNYKDIDLMNPPSYSSWSLLKHDDQKKQQSNLYQNNNIFSDANLLQTNNLGTFASYNQNNNKYSSHQPFPNDNIFVHNMMSTIASATQAPIDGVGAIFDVTQSNFPNAQISQPIGLTYAVVQSITLGLRKILNTVLNNIFVSCSQNYKIKFIF